MGLNERIEIYKKIEEHRKCPLVIYVTSKRVGATGEMSTDALPQLIDQLDRLPAETKAVDFMLVSLGGDPMVAWRIMSLLRERVEKVTVLIPQSAYSAATLLALGADKIIMHKNGHLGPVDMQISALNPDGRRRSFSTEDIASFIEFVKNQLGITDQQHLRKMFQETCREVGALVVGYTVRSGKLAVSLAEKLLKMHLKGEDTSTKRKAIIEHLSRQFHAHDYPVGRKEAREIGLEVEDPDPTLEALMWAAWLDCEKELQEREDFHPITELAKSPAAWNVPMSPVPQLNLASVTQLSTVAAVDEIDQKKSDVPAVDFATTVALIESSRLADASHEKGKVLASRMVDQINYTMVYSFRGWQRMHEHR